MANDETKRLLPGDDLKQLLVEHRLEEFTERLLGIGVTCRVDLENVESKDLSDMGLTLIQKNRFRKMVTSTGLRHWDSTESFATVSPRHGQTTPSLGRNRPKFHFSESSSYTLNYIVLQNIERSAAKTILDLDPTKSTVETLKESILKSERLQGTQFNAELYSTEGVPLSNDPYLATWTLSARCIENESTICVILRDPNIGFRGYQMWDGTVAAEQGAEYIYCETSRGDIHKVQATLEKDTPREVKKKIANLASIPDSVQHLRLPGGSLFTMNDNNSLANNGIKEGDTILIDIQSIDSKTTEWHQNFNCDVKPQVGQTPKGMSTFASFLCVVVAKLDSSCLRLIRELTCWPPLIVALKKLNDRSSLTFCEQVAVVEGLYFLFRRILPIDAVKDKEVFEYTALCWAYLLQESKNGHSSDGEFREMSLSCSHCNTRYFLPVKIPGKPGEVMCLHDVEKDAAKSTSIDENIQCTADLNMQRLLFCHPMSAPSCYIWDPPNNATMSLRLKAIPRMSLNDLKVIQGKFSELRIKAPLQLKGGSISVPLVTLNEFGLPVVFTEMSKSAMDAYPLGLYDPASKERKTEQADSLAERTKKYFNDTDVVTAPDCQFTRTPSEAIVIAVDVSGSMDSNSFDGSDSPDGSEMSRLQVVQEMFYTFADRSMAYNFEHVVGLITFNSRAEVTGKLTELFVEFKSKIEQVKAFGMTAIYDAISTSIDQFDGIKDRFPLCKRRIICLSDGVDTKSTSDPLTIAQQLEEGEIVLDAIHIGTENDKTLKGLCHASGGFCFHPTNIIEASKLFELETMLSVGVRKERPRQHVKTTSDLERLSRSKPYDEHPQHRLPSDISKPVTNTDASLKIAANHGQTFATSQAVFRVMQEMSKIHRKPHPAFKIFPSQDSVCFWRIFMTGPTGTPYENGVFSLFAEFPDRYPTVPPVVRFITQIYHCNINSVGRICHSIFDRDYSSDITVYKILSAIYGLLMTPEPDDPLDTVVAEEYHTDPTQYNTIAREMTRKHAGKPLAECIQGILGSSTDYTSRPPPKHLVCHITKELFVEPVETPGGYVYERLAIERHLQEYHTDPQSKEPLTIGELQDATSLRKAADDFRASQAKVKAWWFNK